MHVRARNVLKGHLVGAVAALLVFAACGPTNTAPSAATSPFASSAPISPSPSGTAPHPSTSLRVTCADPPVAPSTTLTCAAAVAAAIFALPADHAPIERVSFSFGGYCPPNARCAYVPPQFGSVVFWPTPGVDALWVVVVADAGGLVSIVRGPAPFPPSGATPSSPIVIVSPGP